MVSVPFPQQPHPSHPYEIPQQFVSFSSFRRWMLSASNRRGGRRATIICLSSTQLMISVRENILGFRINGPYLWCSKPQRVPNEQLFEVPSKLSLLQGLHNEGLKNLSTFCVWSSNAAKWLRWLRWYSGPSINCSNDRAVVVVVIIIIVVALDQNPRIQEETKTHTFLTSNSWHPRVVLLTNPELCYARYGYSCFLIFAADLNPI